VADVSIVGFAFWFSKAGSILTPRLLQVLAGLLRQPVGLHRLFRTLQALFKSRVSNLSAPGNERFVKGRRVNPNNFFAKLKRRNVYKEGRRLSHNCTAFSAL
jgi:hypothetical protein